jgi:NhaP-type Na+/H+ or K+/H+ antiporter
VATAFWFIGIFIENIVISSAIGIFFGVMACLIFKKMRFTTTSSITETILILSFGYMAFAMCELFKFSGLFSILICGVVMAHYAWHSLSP